MARTVTALTATQIKTAKPKEKDYKLFDGGGLFLFVTKKNSKLWRLKYKFDGKEKLLALGAYPAITLSYARELRELHKAELAKGINPSEVKQEEKRTEYHEETKHTTTFKSIALKRLEQIKSDISEPHYKRSFNSLKNDVYPIIGDMQIDDIKAKDIKKVLNVMMERDIRTSAKQVYSVISKTFKYAIAKDLAESNPAIEIGLEEILGKCTKKHYPTITDDRGIKNLLISIKEYQGETSTKYALEMLAYTFVRPTNVRLALWSEIDLATSQWVIPAKKMKTKDEFIIPLSNTLIEILQEIKLYSGDSKYLFPSTKSKSTPLSDGALLGAVRRMGYTKEEFTPHGFRAMFSTIAHEKSPFKYEVIETQLAHSVGNSVSQAYNRAKYLDERVNLMQWWSEYLNEVHG